MNLGATPKQLAQFGASLNALVRKVIGEEIELLSVFGSLGDTMEIDELREMLDQWVATGATMTILSRDPAEIAAALTDPNVTAELKRRGFRVIDGPSKEPAK